eukprot:466574-Lingulodinium_polyedra.AAC.1
MATMRFEHTLAPIRAPAGHRCRKPNQSTTCAAGAADPSWVETRPVRRDAPAKMAWPTCRPPWGP